MGSDIFRNNYYQGDLISEDNVGQRARIIQTYFGLLLREKILSLLLPQPANRIWLTAQPDAIQRFRCAYE